MKIALVQYKIAWENKEKNIEWFERILREDRSQAQLFLLPEMSFTGFSMNVKKTAESDGLTLKKMTSLAKTYEVGIGFGWVKDVNGEYENHYTIVDQTGHVVTDYVKIHPFMQEKDVVKCGDTISTFEIDRFPMGLFICFDLRFPELFRMIAKEVHAVFIPANWPRARSEHWKKLLQARAIENQLYILAINCVGEIGGLDYSGDSCAINPNGDVIEMISDKPGIILYELEDDVEEYRTKFPALKELDPSIFGKTALFIHE